MNNVKNVYKSVSRKIKLSRDEFISTISDLSDGTYLIWIGNNDTSKECDLATEITYMYNSKTGMLEKLFALDALDLVIGNDKVEDVRISDLLEEAV